VPNDGLERHHILPKCLGGKNAVDNIVVLTPREHFIAHLILTKCYTGDPAFRMASALHKMAFQTGKHRTLKLTARQYDSVRKLHSGWAKIHYNSKEYRDRTSLVHRARWQKIYEQRGYGKGGKPRPKLSQDVRNRITREALKERYRSPGYLERFKQAHLKRWQDPEFKERHRARMKLWHQQRKQSQQ
jgi:hypothetical protein